MSDRKDRKIFADVNGIRTEFYYEGILGIKNGRVVRVLDSPDVVILHIFDIGVTGPAITEVDEDVATGVEVTVEFDEDRFAGSGLFLFASVLERFYGLYCTINSFTKFVASTKQSGELRRWPPRAGERVLV